ncbi:uncharacterized protein MYCFIDRAFT_174881 [Pseudocercospora fijiensis CIRAD86]|uniref:Uncharacterized protein n=1 Tax=Pseudocercospora fijiensis (strain CIRAD86) TaxID=383855 RepID=M3AFS6_PSEFD|nr:uncharacterized protein MYCFIDRAFT_174881 [Pseudocercospora fijiensis CIRAD86]EME83446.1 hypothetical protein MYCFIDRAFT_174881 [Pseudocercospora fijiensis CIRAD86]
MSICFSSIMEAAAVRAQSEFNLVLTSQKANAQVHSYVSTNGTSKILSSAMLHRLQASANDHQVTSWRRRLTTPHNLGNADAKSQMQKPISPISRERRGRHDRYTADRCFSVQRPTPSPASNMTKKILFQFCSCNNTTSRSSTEHTLSQPNDIARIDDQGPRRKKNHHHVPQNPVTTSSSYVMSRAESVAPISLGGMFLVVQIYSNPYSWKLNFFSLHQG